MLHKAYAASFIEFCVIAFVRISIGGLTLALFSLDMQSCLLVYSLAGVLLVCILTGSVAACTGALGLLTEPF